MERRALCLAFAGIGLGLQPGPSLARPPVNARTRQAEIAGAVRLAGPLAAAGANLGAPVFLQILKQPAELRLFMRRADDGFGLVKTYPVCAMSGGLGPKQREGDLQAPEGLYSVRANQLNPASQFHLSFNLGFPNAHDRARGWTGSFLMVHGACASIGCYAMTDPVIEEIWTAMAAAYRAGQAAIGVHCFPFALTPQALWAHRDHPWGDFWRRLEPAWRLFAETGRPPRVRVRAGAYVVTPG